jgi:diguanylate cyclase (GGDEF)-like protein
MSNVSIKKSFIFFIGFFFLTISSLIIATVFLDYQRNDLQLIHYVNKQVDLTTRLQGSMCDYKNLKKKELQSLIAQYETNSKDMKNLLTPQNLFFVLEPQYLQVARVVYEMDDKWDNFKKLIHKKRDKKIRKRIKSSGKELVILLELTGTLTTEYSLKKIQYVEYFNIAALLIAAFSLIFFGVVFSRIYADIMGIYDIRSKGDRRSYTHEIAKIKDDILNNHESLQIKSKMDPLTGIFNRNGLEEELAKQVPMMRQGGMKTYMTIIDIDNFKSVNDTYGHEFGDRVLKRLSHILANHKNPSDIIARFGGEEFIIIVFSDMRENVMTLVNSIREEVSHIPLKTDDNQIVNVSFSGGTTIFLEDESFEVALKRADDMLYKAKGNGKNRIYFQ